MNTIPKNSTVLKNTYIINRYLRNLVYESGVHILETYSYIPQNNLVVNMYSIIFGGFKLEKQNVRLKSQQQLFSLLHQLLK